MSDASGISQISAQGESGESAPFLRKSNSLTQPQSVGGNYSPAKALKPHILTYINYSSTVSHYIYSQVLASIIHPRTSLITFHIIHIPFPYYKYVRSCQEAASTDSAAILPSPPRPNHVDRPTNQRAQLPSPGRIVRMSAPISGLILVRMSTVLLLLWHSCRISRRPTYTSNIILGYKVQSLPAYNTNPSNATLPPAQTCSKQGAIEGKPLTA